MTEYIEIINIAKDLWANIVLICVLCYAVYYMAKKIDIIHEWHKIERKEANEMNWKVLLKLTWAIDNVASLITTNTIETQKTWVVLNRVETVLNKT